jgi:transposase
MATRKKKRKNRRQSLPENFHPNAAGIDCGATAHYVAVPEDRDRESVRWFFTFTEDLHKLADWLQQCGIDTVAMESTGVYWIPVYEILESRGFDVNLVEPGKVKNAPGRKTDVSDCQWIQQLHTCGLLEASFRPPEDICVLRSYVRHQEMLVAYAGQHIQHMQKALMEMNVQLHHVLSDITGQTGLRIIAAILDGERDPRRLAALRDRRCKNDEETISKALRGHWREDHIFSLRQAYELYLEYQRRIADVEAKITAHVATFEDKSGGAPQPTGVKDRGRKRNAEDRQMRQALFRMTGVDVMSIDGIGAQVALGVISEIGTDMSAWANEKKFCSWLCLCPGNHKTGGRVKRGKTRTRASRNRAAHLFRMAAYTLMRSKSALGAYLRRMKTRLGPPKAITATAHKIAKIFYNMLKYGKEYVDRGEHYYEQQYRSRVLSNLRRRAASLGLELVPKPPKTEK